MKTKNYKYTRVFQKNLRGFLANFSMSIRKKCVWVARYLPNVQCQERERERQTDRQTEIEKETQRRERGM
jgi:hypothetical protein